MNGRRKLIMLFALCLVTACSSTPDTSAPPPWSPPPSPNPSKVDGPGDTAILVLDHFNALEPQKRKMSGTSPGGRLPNCSYTGTATNEVGSGGGGDGLPPGISHGQAVFETARDDLRGRGLKPAAPPAAIAHPLIVSKFVNAWTHKDKTLLLVGVEIQDYDTALLSAELRAVMDEVNRQTRITRFVLNMSFVVAPCDIKAWFDKAGPGLTTKGLLDSYRAIIDGVGALNDLRDELEALVATNPTVAQVLASTELARAKDAALINLFHQRLVQEMRQTDWPPRTEAYQQVTQEPLRAGFHIILQPNGYQVIPVGASGNGIFEPGTSPARRVRPDFPFAPALWNVVVSAGATEFDRPAVRAEYSNGAEVMLDPSNLYKAKGTSFAAPHLAAMEALYLLAGGQVVCQRHIPPLGYTNIDGATTPTWRNLWLSEVPLNGDPALAECTVFNKDIPAPAP